MPLFFSSLTNLNGPVPTGWDWNVSDPTLVIYFLGTISCNESISGRIGQDCSVLITTVYRSIILTSETGPKRAFRGEVIPSIPSFLNIRSNENLTSSAVNSSLLWNFTPFLSLNFQEVSSNAFQDSASWGTTFMSASRVVSESSIFFKIICILLDLWIAGSSLRIESWTHMTNWFFRLAASDARHKGALLMSPIQ